MNTQDNEIQTGAQQAHDILGTGETEWTDFDNAEIESQRRWSDEEDWAEFEAECAKMAKGGAK